MRNKKQASLTQLSPDPGPWFLDWSKVDYDGPFPWPKRESRDFYLLAGFLASLNTLPLDQVMNLERANGRSAVHALAPWDLSDEASDHWSKIYEDKQLDQKSSQQLDIISMTYCIEQFDSRRVVVAFDGQSRIVYPLWWDQHHLVSGSNGKTSEWQECSSSSCHHEPDRNYSSPR